MLNTTNPKPENPKRIKSHWISLAQLEGAKWREGASDGAWDSDYSTILIVSLWKFKRIPRKAV
jgi:hypothetical protein